MPETTTKTERQELSTRARRCLDTQTAKLLSAASDEGWEGRLSSSALASAVAAGALLSHVRATGSDTCQPAQAAAHRALGWIADHQNADGGWGDSPESPSNLATTLLAFASFCIADANTETTDKAKGWLKAHCGSTDPADWRKAVLDFYAEDRTFSVPILSFCTACGLFDEEEPWRSVPQLPFELSCAPHSLFRLLKLQVVSYALPALIAIGLVRHRKAPAPGPIRWLRNRATGPALKLLQRIQPQGGGFLEAAPLTGFVLLSLSEAGLPHHPVADKARRFLLDNQRADGSWPIDTHLAGWVTSLAIDALPSAALDEARRDHYRELLLKRQYREEHPYTRSAPGGWSWSPRDGGVPDGDDTAAALKALHRLDRESDEAIHAARAGCLWLANLQNRDGGVPTFCRGWGKLPFDQSCPDITAHALRAWRLWRPQMDAPATRRLQRAEAKALRYLVRSQQPDGSWHPLWFGNQGHPEHHNPVFGTAQVLTGLAAWPQETLREPRRRAVRYLLQAQNQDGGWGGDRDLSPTIEETALALRALTANGDPETVPAAEQAAAWLVAQLELSSDDLPSAPIGLYFASLWYDEALYPRIFAIEALRHLCNPNPNRNRFSFNL